MSESVSDYCFISSYCVYLPFGISWIFFIKSWTCVLNNKNWGNLVFCVRIYSRLARSQAMFNVCSSYRCQRLPSPLMSLALYPLLTLTFPIYSSNEASIFFSCNSLLYLRITGIMVICRGGRELHTLLVECHRLQWGCLCLGAVTFTSASLMAQLFFFPLPPASFLDSIAPNLFPWIPDPFWKKKNLVIVSLNCVSLPLGETARLQVGVMGGEIPLLQIV